MASKDFKASQVRTNKLIASSSVIGEPSLLIYSASTASDFEGSIAASVLSNVGSDVFLFISGSQEPPTHDSSDRKDITLFGGDIVVSGTVYMENLVAEVDMSTTGSAVISGSLFVSQSATIYQGLTVNAEQGSENDGDFTVKGGTGTALLIQPSTDVILFNPSLTDVDTVIYQQNNEVLRVDSVGLVINDNGHADIDFRVESDGEANALFVDAGANELHINSGETAFLTTIHNIDGEAISVTATEVVINDDGVTTIDFRVESDGEDEAIFLDASANTLEINKGETAFLTTIHSVDGEAVSVTATEVVINDDGIATVDFRVETDANTHAIFVNAGTEQVTFLSSSAVPNNITFFVSGAKGGVQDASIGGVSVFGGDVLVSGSLSVGPGGDFTVGDDLWVTHNTYLSGALQVAGNTDLTGSLNVQGDIRVGRYIQHDGDTDTYIEFGNDNIDIVAGTDVKFALVEVGTQDVIVANALYNDVDFHAYGDAGAHKLLIKAIAQTGQEQVLILSGGNYRSVDEAAGADVAFYVSGTIGSQGSSQRGMSLFGGDVLMSGTLYVDVPSTRPAAAFGDLDGAIGVGNDAVLFVSGAVGDRGGSTRSTAIFGGDVVISGALHGGSALQIGAHEDDLGAEVGFFVSGARSSRDADETVALFGGDTVISGTLYALGSNAGVPAAAFGDTAGGTGIGNDAHVWVSGSIGSQGTSTKGTAVFGGDTVISGALEVGVSGSGQDVKFYGGVAGAGGDGIGLHWDADANERGKLTLGANDYGVDFQIFGEDSNNYVSWDQSSNAFSIYVPQGEIRTKGDAIFDYSSQGWDFTVNSNSRVGLFVDGSEDRVYILSGGTGTGGSSPNPANARDLSFFVSGSIGSRDSTAGGTAVFGGDLFISGGLSAISSEPHVITSSLNSPAAIQLNATAGGIQIYATGSAGQDIDILNFSGSVNITSTEEANNAIYLHADGGPNESIKIHSDQGTGVLNLVGGGDLPSIYMTSDVGGVGIESKANLAKAVYIHANGGTDSQIMIRNRTGTGADGGQGAIHIITDAAGDIELDSGGGFFVNCNSRKFELIGAASSVLDTTAGTITIDGKTGVYLQENGQTIIGIDDARDVIIHPTNDGDYDDPDMSFTGYLKKSGDFNMQAGHFVFNELGSSTSDGLYDFRLESNNFNKMLFVSGGDDTVLIGGKAYNGQAVPDLLHVLQGNYNRSCGVRIEHLMDTGATANVSGSLIFSHLNSSGNGTRTPLAEIIMEPLGNLVLSASKQDTDIIFKVNDGGTSKELMRLDGSTGQVLVLSGGSDRSFDEAGGADVAFYVSGSSGTRGSSERGTSVFGGDVAVSGTLYAIENGISGSYLQTSLIKSDHPTDMSHITLDAGGVIYLDSYDHGRVVLREHGTEYLKFERGDTTAEDDHAIIQNMENGKDTVFQQYDGNETLRLTDSEQVLILSGGSGASYDEAGGADVAFYVSGSSGTRGSSERGTSVFGGDVVISGTLHGGSPLKIGTAMEVTGAIRLKTESGAPTIGDDEAVIYVLNDGGTKKLYWKNSDGAQQEVGSGTGGITSGSFNVPSPAEFVTTASVSFAGTKGFSYTADSVGSDVKFFVSGSVGDRDDSSKGATSVFGGDVYASGSLSAPLINRAFLMNPQTISDDITIPDAYNAVLYGPTITFDATIEVGTDSVLQILT